MTEILGNTIQDYTWFIGAVLLGFIFKKLISKYLSHLLFKIVGTKGTEVGIDKFDALLTKPIGFFIMLSIIYLGSSHIEYPSIWNLAPENEIGLRMFINRGFSLIYIYSIFWIFLKVIDFIGLMMNKRAEATENKMDDQLIPFIIEIAKIITYIFALVIVMGNVFEVDITALAAGLGIGGIALAMASKESLENLLGSFTIFFDQPFTVGDTVTVGTVTGTVEKVGFRSTRIRTFDKSLVTVPNKKMIDAELDNLGMRPVRRVKFNIGLTYETAPEQIKAIVTDIQAMINQHPKTNQEGKVRFQEFGSSSLDILVMYFVDSPKWNDLIDVKEDVNYKIMEIVKKHNSDFAFPSTTVYLQK
ncbi:mechanosensitive ion channel family protein [Flavobacteriales bacterium]|nr:mechanosensitive ion channel family protein [Flavobacteriales bacterium]MDG1348333.1 mechanosensitive ion channel family protein [Flavobacteriales bacterium]